MRGEHAPWDWTILNALRAEGDGEADLPDIYRFIERQQQEFPVEYLPTSQFEETRWGGRPMYRHTARSVITNKDQWANGAGAGRTGGKRAVPPYRRRLGATEGMEWCVGVWTCRAET